MAVRIGIDIGGTFTDVVVEDGEVVWGKAETTHYDLKQGLLNAVGVTAEKLGMTLENVVQNAESIVYSTTVGTNTLIERTGPRLGLLVTQGFEDTLKVGRARSWADGMPYEVRLAKGRAQKPVPLVSDELTVGIRERIDSVGNVIAPLVEEEVLEKVQYLVDQGVRGFVVVLLNSFVNPKHEQMIRDIVYQEYPEAYLGRMPVLLSNEVSPQIGEYRRTLSVIIDAYLRANTEEHLLELTGDLREMGYQHPLFLAKCTGGVSSTSRTRPIHLLGSSPVAGIMGARAIANVYDLSHVVITDVGGTSFDAGLMLSENEHLYDADPIFDRWRVQVPVISHWSIGAGGGSIAHVEENRLQVGPKSARSNPGPACYAKGGTEPTVTDADVALGYIDPDYFLGGRIKLDKTRAIEAIKIRIADPLGISVEQAAWDIRRTIDGVMGQELFMRIALHSGADPRDFSIFAVGGAGPLHAAGYADYADIDNVAIFPFGSTFGAYGTLSMDLSQTYEKSHKIVFRYAGDRGYNSEAIEALNNDISDLLVSARRDIAEEGFDSDKVGFQLEFKICYGMQRQTLEIPLPFLELKDEADLDTAFQLFDSTYGEKFGSGARSTETGAEVHMVRLNVVGPMPDLQLPETPETTESSSIAAVGSRNAYWEPEKGYVTTPVYRMALLKPGMSVEGPALIESEDTVCAVTPDRVFRLDKHHIGWLYKK